MGKNIGQIYKYSQSQISTFSLKASVSSYSDPQTSSAIKLTTTSVPSVKDKNQNNSVLYSQNTIQNDASIKNSDDIQSCETSRKQMIAFQPLQHLIIIHKVLLPHPQVY